MVRFRIYGTVSGGKYLGEYEAETEQEAKDMALESDKAYISLCHVCDHECEDAQIVEVTAELASDPDPIPGVVRVPQKCHYCNDTGMVACWWRDGQYAFAGPVPDDAKGYFDADCCWYCDSGRRPEEISPESR
jgi:hypothetical protein